LPNLSYTVNDPGHSHGVNDPGHRHQVGGYTNVNGGSDAPTISNNGSGFYSGYSTTGISIQNATTGISVSDSNGNGSHNIMQPSAVVTKIIKY
jgi:hypothetical protein